MDRLKSLLEDRRFSWMLLAGAFAMALTGDYAAATVALGACYAIALMGEDLVVGYAGMITVGHGGLLGAGAYAAASLSWKLGAPMPLGMAAGIAAGALAGWLLSLPALKAQDKYVALATLVTGMIFSINFVEAESITNGSMGITMPKSVAFGHALSALDFACLGLIATGFCMVALNRIAASAVGRGFEAMRDSEVAANCLGVSASKQRQIAFILSGVFCGFAGALFSYSQGYVSPTSFGFDTSVTLLLAIMLGSKKSRSGALIGAGTVIYLPLALNSAASFAWVAGLCLAASSFFAAKAIIKNRDFTLATPCAVIAAMLATGLLAHTLVDWRNMIYGLLILGVTYYMPNGLAGSLPKKVEPIHSDGAAAQALTRAAPGAEPALELRAVGKAFDGFVALEGVDLRVEPGEVCGLIGPNGAGKSTMMNLITKVYEPSSGHIRICGRDADAMGSVGIAHLGVSRTFQNLQIFGGLSAIENVLVGLTARHETSIAKIAAGLGRSKDRACRARAQALLEFVGLGHRAELAASALSYGEQRYLEIARALATDPKLLLLDEPAAGLRGAELARLKDIIRAVSAEGIAVLVIEHHLDVIRETCSKALALNGGKPLAYGTPAEVLRHPAVLEALMEKEEGEAHGHA